MDSEENRRCSNLRCNLRAMEGSEYCFLHSGVSEQGSESGDESEDFCRQCVACQARIRGESCWPNCSISRSKLVRDLEAKLIEVECGNEGCDMTYKVTFHIDVSYSTEKVDEKD